MVYGRGGVVINEPWFPLRTERLLLREFSANDEAAMHGFASDPLVSRYDDWGPNTSDDTKRVLGRWIGLQQTWPRDELNFAAVVTAEDALIGSLRLEITDRENATAMIGYTFDRRYWNRGFGTEAAFALLRCAFEQLHLHRVWASCDTRNTGSWRVMEKAGMRREAHFRRDKLQRGEWRDTYVYAMLDDEWRANPRR